jgi:hypothetical protein
VKALVEIAQNLSFDSTESGRSTDSSLHHGVWPHYVSDQRRKRRRRRRRRRKRRRNSTDKNLEVWLSPSQCV